MHIGFKRFRAVGLVVAALIVVCAVPVVSYAQDLTVDQQIQMIRSLTAAERQATMAANVKLTDAEATKFWPIYRDYRNDVAKVNDSTIALMQELADNFDSLTDARAKSITDRWLAGEKDRLDLKTKYVAKFEKAVGAVKAARVLQIENKMDALVDVGLAKTIPLVPAS